MPAFKDLFLYGEKKSHFRDWVTLPYQLMFEIIPRENILEFFFYNDYLRARCSEGIDSTKQRGAVV